MPGQPKWPRRPRGQGRQATDRHGRAPDLGPLRALGPLLSRYGDVVRSLVIYAWCLAVLLLLYIWLDGIIMFQHFLEYNAQATGFLAGLFDPTASVTGRIVETDGFAISIVEECTILAPLAIFTAAVLAFPSTIFRKMLGIALVVVVLSAVNLVRTTSLFYIGSTFPETLEVVHLLVWQSLMVIFAVALWLVWMRRWGSYGQV